MNKIDNKLSNFTLMDLHDMIDKINNEEASIQANTFIKRLEDNIRYNARNNIRSMKYIIFSDYSHDIIHNNNIKYLSNNGFKIWKIKSIYNDQSNKKKKNEYNKHYVSWLIEDEKSFKDEVFNNIVSCNKSNSDYVESSFQEITIK